MEIPLEQQQRQREQQLLLIEEVKVSSLTQYNGHHHHHQQQQPLLGAGKERFKSKQQHLNADAVGAHYHGHIIGIVIRRYHAHYYFATSLLKQLRVSLIRQQQQQHWFNGKQGSPAMLISMLNCCLLCSLASRYPPRPLWRPDMLEATAACLV